MGVTWANQSPFSQALSVIACRGPRGYEALTLFHYKLDLLWSLTWIAFSELTYILLLQTHPALAMLDTMW